MNRRAFSLIEVLIAVALLVVLSGAMLGFVVDLLNTRERIETVTSQQRAANTLFEQLEADLMCSLVGDSRFGAGIEGEPHRLSILTRSVAMRQAVETERDDSAALGDLQRAEYVFDQNAHTLRARRAAARSAQTETPLSRDPEGSSSGDWDELTRSIYRVRFRYHDGTMWRDRFNSREQDQLPIAVEVAIWYEPGRGAEWGDDANDLRDAWDGDDEPDRLTFDFDPSFDEQEWAMRADRDFRPERRPNRIRIITVPDADEDTFGAEIDDEEAL